MLATSNGTQIHYTIDGAAGAPWLTFVTGIANDLTMWDGQIAPLAGDFRILRYDFRGHGGSPAMDGDCSLDLLIDDLTGLWDHLGVARSHVAGLGLGGALLHGLALRHPERVLSAAACCCRASMEPDFAAMWPKFVEIVKAHGSLEPMVEPTVERWFTPDFRLANPEIIEAVRAMIANTTPQGYYGAIDAFLGLDYERYLPDIQVPWVYIGGAQDHIGGPPEIMQRLADKLPGAEYVAVADAAHIANLQNPAGFNTALAAFLHSQKA